MSEKDNLSEEERTRIQNELTKSDLTDRLGAEFGFVAENSEDFTPEMEKQFLENIARIEGGGKESYVPIRSLISNKAMKVAAAKAKQEKWEEACDELLKAMISVGVVTEKPEWISFRGWYGFLKTDFLDHTIPSPPPIEEGATQRHMVGVYYDQVRQDSPDMMAQMASEFILDILNVSEDFQSADWLADEVRNGPELQSKAAAVAKILDWRAQWSSIKPEAFNSNGLMRGPDGAMYFTFSCAFTAHLAAGKSVTQFESDGVVQFIPFEKGLQIVGLSMPGFEL